MDAGGRARAAARRAGAVRPGRRARPGRSRWPRALRRARRRRAAAAARAPSWSLQLDEPSLPAVLAGADADVGGCGAPARAVAEHVAEDVLRDRASRPPAAPGRRALLRARPPVDAAPPGGRRGRVASTSTLARRPLRRRARRGGRGRPGAARRPGAGACRPDAGLSDAAATVEPVRRLWQRLGLDPRAAGRRRSSSPRPAAWPAPVPGVRRAAGADATGPRGRRGVPAARRRS